MLLPKENDYIFFTLSLNYIITENTNNKMNTFFTFESEEVR